MKLSGGREIPGMPGKDLTLEGIIPREPVIRPEDKTDRDLDCCLPGSASAGLTLSHGRLQMRHKRSLSQKRKRNICSLWNDVPAMHGSKQCHLSAGFLWAPFQISLEMRQEAD